MGGGSSYTPELAAFRWYDDDNADLDSQTALDTQGTAITLDTDKRAVLRVRIQETGNKNGGNNSHRFEFRINAGSWNDLTTTSTGCQLADGLATDLTAIDGTTNVERLTGGTGSYDSSGGYYIDTSNTTTAGNLAATDRWEMAACIRLVAASLSDTDVIQFRVRDSASTTFTDTAVPQLTVNLVGNTDQTDFRAYDNDGSESGSTARAAENTNWTDSPDRHIVVRFAVENNGGASKTITTPRLEYNKNSGGWNAVTAASSNVRVVGSGNNRHLTDHGATTARIVATGTFTAGTIGVNDGDLPSKTIANGEYTNFVWSIFIRAADVVDTDTIQLRVTDGGTALDSYTQTPTITVAKTPGWRCTDHRWRLDDNTEALATWANVQTGSIVIAPGAQRRLRFMMKNGNNQGTGLDDKPQGFSLRYRINNGSWNTLTNSTAAAVFCYNSSNLTAFTGTTTEQLAGPGTFVTGHVVDDNVQTDGEVTFTVNAEETEVEVSVQFHATGITAGDLIEFAPCMIEPAAGEVGRIENFTYMAAIATAAGTESITEFLEGVLPTGAYAGTTDTWVDENAPTSSSGGTDSLIRIDGGTGVQRHALAKFDVSSITSTETVDAAILVGYCGSGQGGTDAFSVYEVTGSWSETTTWDTKPTNGSTVFATTLTDNSNFHFEGLKLNSNGIALAQGWVDGGTTNNGLVIKPANPATETSGQTYFSKDRQLGNFEERADIRLIIVHHAAATNYTLTALKGSYSLTGQAANLLIGYNLVAAKGSYALTGQAATLSRGFLLTAVKGSYSLTGQAANLLIGYTLTATQGSYALTGQSANLLRGYTLVASQGSYSLTGNAATLTKNIPLTAEKGSYALTGQAASLLWNHAITAVKGTYSLTGQDVTLNKGFLIAAAKGSYSVTGGAANLLWGHALLAAQGSYALTGQAATLTKNIPLTAEKGSYSLTGQAANLLWDHLLTAAQGSYALTGQAASLLWGHTLIAAQGSYALTGQNATLSKGFLISAAQGSYSVTGQAANLLHNRYLAALQGSYALTGQNVSLLWGHLLVAAKGAYALTGQAATLTRGYTLTAAQGSYALTGYDATLTFSGATGITLTAEAGSYALTGAAANLLRGYALLAAKGAYTLTGQDVVFLRGYVLAASTGSYATNGQVTALKIMVGDYERINEQGGLWVEQAEQVSGWVEQTEENSSWT